jgi:hypothetical protein
MNDPLIVSEQDHEDLQQRVSMRTLELAKLAGRSPHEIKQVDYEQAKREIRSDTSQSER